MKRGLILLGIAVTIFAVALPFVPLFFLRSEVERALTRDLGRRVELDGVYFTIFTGPGLTLEGVTLHDDARAGREPLAYAGTVQARLDVIGFLIGKPGFSSLRFSDATLNLVKTDGGPWNFQLLLERTQAGKWPSISMRAGRVNLKFGQTKSVLYFDDADVDVRPAGEGGRAVDVRFSGVPARTDRSAENLGHFFVQGTAMPTAQGQRLDLKVELEPSALGSVARLFDQTGSNTPGVIAMNAQISGVGSHLDVTGEVDLDDSRGSALLPQRAGRWKLAYKGTLDSATQELNLESSAGASDVVVRLRASNVLSVPLWQASAELKDAPLSGFVDAARRLGAPVPEKLSAEAAISGAVEYCGAEGLSGDLEAHDLVVALAGSPVIKSASAAVSIRGRTLSLSPATFTAGDEDTAQKDTAQVEGTYSFGAAAGADPPGLDLKISTRGMDVGALRFLALGSASPLDRVQQGTWRGSMRYQWTANEPLWSGEYDLQNARVAIDGIAEPLRVDFAMVKASEEKIIVTRLAGRAGDIRFRGDYQWVADAERPHRFRIVLEETTAAEAERVFRPALARGGGFIARTLGLGNSEAPDWLAQRKAEGTLSIIALNAGDHRLSVRDARLVWDGVHVTLAGIRGRVDDAVLSGDLNIDLAANAPKYRFEGSLVGLDYSGGQLDFSGYTESEGLGMQLLATLHSAGAMRGRSILFSPEAEFRSVAGRFDVTVVRGAARWKLSDLELMQGGEMYLGQGATQPDGRLVLDLASRGKQVRYTGGLLALAPQP